LLWASLDNDDVAVFEENYSACHEKLFGILLHFELFGLVAQISHSAIKGKCQNIGWEIAQDKCQSKV
jgi:hypothetical protein